MRVMKINQVFPIGHVFLAKIRVQAAPVRGNTQCAGRLLVIMLRGLLHNSDSARPLHIRSCKPPLLWYSLR